MQTMTTLLTSTSLISFHIELAAFASGNLAQLNTLRGFVGPNARVFFLTTVLFLTFRPAVYKVVPCLMYC